MATDSPQLFRQIADWDGNCAETIREILVQYQQAPGFCSRLVACLDSPELVGGASWLLKNYLEQGGQISKRDVAGVHRRLKHLVHWADQLHFLQCAQYWSVPDRFREPTVAFIRQSLDHERPFVRAWAHHSFFWLANQFPEFRDEVRQRFQRTMESEKASVQARVRKLTKRGFDA